MALNCEVNSALFTGCSAKECTQAVVINTDPTAFGGIRLHDYENRIIAMQYEQNALNAPYADRPGAAGKTVNEFLAFTLGKEEYGIDILKVQEIRGYENVTRIANAPEFIKGVVNLRGIIVPIVDMRIRFQLGDPSYDQFTVVIILNIAGRVVGMVVDSVSDVTQLTPEQIKPAPEMGSVLNTDYLIGLGTLDERMLILLDIDRLMSNEEMGLIEKVSA
jgi:purine-binding chemotaxis protein CheW